MSAITYSVAACFARPIRKGHRDAGCAGSRATSIIWRHQSPTKPYTALTVFYIAPLWLPYLMIKNIMHKILPATRVFHSPFLCQFFLCSFISIVVAFSPMSTPSSRPRLHLIREMIAKRLSSQFPHMLERHIEAPCENTARVLATFHAQRRHAVRWGCSATPQNQVVRPPSQKPRKKSRHILPAGPNPWSLL